ncbi:MAG: hypothetical protein V1734_06445 [Nanoarchaeota archaeon]
MSAKRIYKPKNQSETIKIVKIITIAAAVIILFSLLAVIYAEHFSKTSKCLRTAADDAVLKIAANGGFLEVSDGIKYNSYDVPLYMKQGVESMPSMEEVESAMLEYVKANSRCEGEIRIKVTDDEVQFGRFFRHAGVNVNLPESYEKAKVLFDSQKSADAISLAELARMAKQGDYVLHINANNDTILYFMTFTKEHVNCVPLVYSFGIRR